MTIRKKAAQELGRQLFDKTQVCSKTNLAPTTLDKLEARGLFPARIRLTYSRVAWDSLAVDQWIAERIASSAAGTPLADDPVAMATAPVAQLQREVEVKRTAALRDLAAATPARPVRSLRKPAGPAA